MKPICQSSEFNQTKKQERKTNHEDETGNEGEVRRAGAHGAAGRGLHEAGAAPEGRRRVQKDGAANIKDRRLITDAYKAFAAENHDALSAEGGVRVGNLRVWIEVTRAIHAEIVG